MPGTVSPTQDWDNGILTRKSGFAISNADLSYVATIDDDAGDFDRGAIGYLTTTGTFTPGYHDTAMPLLVFNAADDRDVNGQIGNTITNALHLIPCTGAYEVFTTEYDTEQDYTIGRTLLKASEDSLGTITISPTAYNTKAICGVVSAGVCQDNKAKVNVLHFWTYYMPVVKIS
jgi:hypothetical protein